MPAADLAARFFLAAAVILIACRLVSALGGRARQPPVVGEMITGVLLGPSLLGTLSPAIEAGLFPKALLPVLYVAGQFGLIALMFQAGRELRGYLRPGLGRTALAISGAGIAVPLALGAGLTLMVAGHVAIVVPDVKTGVTAAFVGVTLAITAFPMLARIIVERGLSGTRFGSLALASGGVDDLAAWILLAGVLSLASSRAWPVTKAIAGAVIYVIVLALIIRPLLDRYLRRPVSPQAVFLITMTLVLAGAWFTSSIGLYAVFGAFSIGLVMPPAAAEADAREPGEGTPAAGKPPADVLGRAQVGVTMEGISRVLVPMFFTYSGLNTRFALLGNLRVVLFSLAAIVVAVLGKSGACWLAARLAGESRPVSARVGALMNARGLMQLIALNVGLQAGLVNQDLFSSLVLVALVTTIMTTPILDWLDRRDQAAASAPAILAPEPG
jgi:Kef-type K+ transport system membrane component KefB